MPNLVQNVLYFPLISEFNKFIKKYQWLIENSHIQNICCALCIDPERLRRIQISQKMPYTKIFLSRTYISSWSFKLSSAPWCWCVFTLFLNIKCHRIILPLLNLQKRLESLTEAELQVLLQEVEEEKSR
jgi:hypothetical protein